MTDKKTEETPETPEQVEAPAKPKQFDRFEPIDFSNRKGGEFLNNDYLESKKRVKGEKTNKLSCPRCEGIWWEEKEISMHRADVAVSPGQALPRTATPEGLKGYFVYQCFGCDFVFVPKTSGARPAYAMGAYAKFAQSVEKKNESKE